MKRIIIALMLVSLGTARPAVADPNYAVLGAILGATAGMVIGNNINGISMEVAVPVCAISGGVIGNHYEQHRYDYDGPYRYNNNYHRHYQHYHTPYNHSGRRDYYAPYDRQGYDYHYRYYPPKPASPKKYIPKTINVAQSTPPDLHPGVDLIHISILNNNGIRTDIPIRRINNQFIGPQGERYPCLPTSETLRKKYGL